MRFEINRSLTSTAHEVYESGADARGDRPTDVLAARLFATDQVSKVAVFSNMITIAVSEEVDLRSIETEVESLFIHYKPGVMPTAV